MGIFDFIFHRKKIRERRQQKQIEQQKKREEFKQQEQMEQQRKKEEERKRQEQIEIQMKQEELISLEKNMRGPINDNGFYCQEEIEEIDISLEEFQKIMQEDERSDEEAEESAKDAENLVKEELDYLSAEEYDSIIRYNEVDFIDSRKIREVSSLNFFDMISSEDFKTEDDFLDDRLLLLNDNELHQFAEYQASSRHGLFEESEEYWEEELTDLNDDNYHKNILERTIVNFPELEIKISSSDKESYTVNTDNNVKKEIEEILERREIHYIYHFTRIENLSSILEYGLVPKSLQRKNDINSIHNDEKRIERRLDCTSCSVGFPNYKLFYYFKQNKFMGSKWVVILLNSNVLCLPNHRTYFCLTNAASVLPQVRNLNELCSSESFENMFCDRIVTKENKVIKRSKSSISKDYTTDPQAEILISDVIEPKHIAGIYFNEYNDIDEYISENGTDLINKFNYQVQPRFFAPRKDYMFWEKENKNG